MVEFINEQVVKVLAFLQTDEEEGQGLVEYALIISLVAIACVAGLQALTGGITGTFSTIVASL